MESSKLVASSYSQSSDNLFSLGTGVVSYWSSDTSATSASLVVQSLLGEDWTSNTSDDSSPLMWPANLTDAALLHWESSSKESACRSIFPHVEDWALSCSDLASWKSLRTEWSWESKLLKHSERSADLFTSGWSWIDLDGSSISDPLVALESVPVFSNVFEDPAVVMPVSLHPRPSGWGESSLRWTPVVPLVVIPSIPDLVCWVPFPDNCWGLCLLTPVTYLGVSSILSDKVKALCLGA